MLIYVPSAMYGLLLFIYCFTRTTIFTELFTCYYHQRCRVLSLHQVSLLYTFCICIPSFVLIGCCVSELYIHDPLCPHRNIWPEAVYFCFKRTILFPMIRGFYHFIMFCCCRACGV